MLITAVPWRDDANLGLAYNEFMKMVPDDAWVIFQDHDSMPTTARWHAQFSEAIAFKPDAGAFVAMTNRIASEWQRTGDRESNDLAWHRRFGAERARIRTLLDVTDTKGFGGVMFAVSKAVWAEVGGFSEGGLGCTDHSLHFKLQRAGRKVYLIEGLYVLHWRHWGEPDPTSDFPKATNCPCRGPEIEPTARIRLP